MIAALGVQAGRPRREAHLLIDLLRELCHLRDSRLRNQAIRRVDARLEEEWVTRRCRMHPQASLMTPSLSRARIVVKGELSRESDRGTLARLNLHRPYVSPHLAKLGRTPRI